MLTAKKDIIDAYGHFFVVCDRHQEKEHYPEGYVSRIFSDISRQTAIGDLDSGYWQPNTPKQIEIMEFFGQPKEKSPGRGVLGGIEKLYEAHGKTIFDSFEGAAQKAAELNVGLAEMYAELRQVGKTKKLSFSTDFKGLPIVHKLQPDQVEFPRIITEGTVMHGFVRNPNLDKGEMLFSEVVERAKLFVSDKNMEHEPFRYEYALEIMMPLVSSTHMGKPYHTSTLNFDPQSSAPGKWGYRTYGLPDITFASTREDAEQKFRKYVGEIYRKIRPWLPADAAAAPVQRYVPAEP